jgi:hypothetical protein
MNQVKFVVETLQNTISNHFMIDRLINMNNDREMTAREALLRNAIRQSTLRSIVSRLLSELFDVVVNTAFMICFRRNKLGYMPTLMHLHLTNASRARFMWAFPNTATFE